MKEILIVDDQHAIRLLLQEVFKQEGYMTHIASNGIDAMSMFESKNIDCILLDMKIPGMDGIGILRHLKERGVTVPVVMMSGHSEQQIIKQANELGVTAYFTKPFDIFKVRDEVNKLVMA